MRKIAAVMLALVLSASPCFAEARKTTATVDEVKFNYGVLTTRRDASIFVHSLELLDSGGTQEVATFMEHKLDEIVCGSWGHFDRMNNAQQKMVMKQLQGIKAYREKHPRNAELRVDPREFSAAFGPFDASLAQCADDVLSQLPKARP